MKKVILTDKKILDNLKKKGELAEKNLKILTEMEKMEKEVNKNATKLKMLDEKVRPLILTEVSKTALNEYEELSRVFLDEGKWTMEFTDRLEEFKEIFKKNKK